MGAAKELIVRPVDAKIANRAIEVWHYSGKIVQNSQLHLGVFMRDKLLGVMQFGPSLDKRKLQGLVRGTQWNGFIELNRMAFSDALPRNSESRAIAVAMRMLRKRAPHIEWVVSFADGAQCGDGTIYRASGFVLTGIKESENLVRLPSGEVIHKLTLATDTKLPYYSVTRGRAGGRASLAKFAAATGGEILGGYQLRYVYFLNPDARKRLTVPEIPFSRIEEVGASMYRGKKISRSKHRDDAPHIQCGEGGPHPDPSAPTFT